MLSTTGNTQQIMMRRFKYLIPYRNLFLVVFSQRQLLSFRLGDFEGLFQPRPCCDPTGSLCAVYNQQESRILNNIYFQ